jgi:hypothetical protein
MKARRLGLECGQPGLFFSTEFRLNRRRKLLSPPDGRTAYEKRSGGKQHEDLFRHLSAPSLYAYLTPVSPVKA